MKTRENHTYELDSYGINAHVHVSGRKNGFTCYIVREKQGRIRAFTGKNAPWRIIVTSKFYIKNSSFLN